MQPLPTVPADLQSNAEIAGTSFTERGNCPAENRECWKCGKRCHFSSKCYRKAKPSKGRKVTEKTHHVSDTSDSDEVVNALTEKVNRLRTSESNKALVTFMLSGRAVKFKSSLAQPVMSCHFTCTHKSREIEMGGNLNRATRWCSTIYRRRKPRERLC